MDEIYGVFAQESRENLTELEAGLLRMEQGDHDPETINAIFRAAHTIKGGSGVVELHHIEKFTHILENLLDKLRNNEIAVSSDVITALLKGCDHLDTLMVRVEGGNLDPDPALEEFGVGIADNLRKFLGNDTAQNKDAKANQGSTLAESAAGEVHGMVPIRRPVIAGTFPCASMSMC